MPDFMGGGIRIFSLCPSVIPNAYVWNKHGEDLTARIEFEIHVGKHMMTEIMLWLHWCQDSCTQAYSGMCLATPLHKLLLSKMTGTRIIMLHKIHMKIKVYPDSLILIQIDDPMTTMS